MSHHTPPPWFTCKQLRHRPVLDAVAVAAYLPSRRWTEPAQSRAYPSEECPSFLRTPSRTFVSDRSYHHQQQRSTTTERPRLSLDGGSVRSFDRSIVRSFVRTSQGDTSSTASLLPSKGSLLPPPDLSPGCHSLSLSHSPAPTRTTQQSNRNGRTLSLARQGALSRDVARSIRSSRRRAHGHDGYEAPVKARKDKVTKRTTTGTARGRRSRSALGVESRNGEHPRSVMTLSNWPMK
jgi:hypothetical protein